MISKLFKRWSSYKYRFVPWLLMNFKNRSVRRDTGALQNIVSHDDAVESVLEVLAVLSGRLDAFGSVQERHEAANKLLFSWLGFSLQRRQSCIPDAGRGVFVSRGTVPPRTVVCWYPGTVYLPGDPLLLPSIGNPYIFSCADGRHVDGRGSGLSGLVFGSCAGRDQMGPYSAADLTWRTELPANPLAVGQFVNNHAPGYPCNVRYQELDLPVIPYQHRQYLPYAWYRAGVPPPLRTVVLVSQREIQQGEELFSEYFTITTES